MAKSALETYREALEKNRQMQEAISGGQPNEVVNNLDQENKFQDDLAKLMKLENKQVQNAQKAQEIFDNKASPINTPEDLLDSYGANKNGISLSEYRDLQKRKLEKSNPELLKKIQEANPVMKQDFLKKPELVSNALDDSLDSMLPKQDGSPLTPDELAQMSVENSNKSIPQDISKKEEILNKTKTSKEMSKTTDNNSIPKVGSFGSAGPSKEDLNSIPKVGSFSGDTKSSEPEALTEEEEILKAQRDRDFNSGLSMMLKGFEKAGAGYGGGSVTQLKPDYTGAEGIEQMGKQNYTDLLEKFKKRREASEQLKKDQLTDAQIKKLDFESSGKMTEKEKAMLALEKRKLDIEDKKLKQDLENPKLTPEDRQLRKEGRKEVRQLDTDQFKVEQLLKQLDIADKAFEKYSKNSQLGGTGWAATQFGLKKYYDKDTSQLDTLFNSISLDNMVKMFSGMSKAIDTPQERARFEATQPQLGLDDDVNLERLKTFKENAKELLNKIKYQKSQYTRDGDFVDKESAKLPATETSFSRETSQYPKVVRKGNQQTTVDNAQEEQEANSEGWR